MDQHTSKLCTKCKRPHTDLTKWCKECKERKKLERDNYYANPENVIKRRQTAKSWKESNNDKVRTQQKTWKVNKRNRDQLQAFPHVGNIINQLEDSLRYANENEYELVTVLLAEEDAKFIVEILKQIIEIHE